MVYILLRRANCALGFSKDPKRHRRMEFVAVLFASQYFQEIFGISVEVRLNVPSRTNVIQINVASGIQPILYCDFYWCQTRWISSLTFR